MGSTGLANCCCYSNLTRESALGKEASYCTPSFSGGSAVTPHCLLLPVPHRQSTRALAYPLPDLRARMGRGATGCINPLLPLLTVYP